jgi:phage host-nuclease inhibitor protein Gam
MKKTKRIKIAAPTISVSVSTRHDAERVLGEIAHCTAAKQKIVAEMDAAIQAIKDRCAPELANCDAFNKVATEALALWASANPAEFPKDRKSIQLTSGTIGFRTATPSLQLLNKKWNWEKVTEAVARILPAFIRSKPEVAKDNLLAQRDEEPIKAVLPMVGLKVVQGESFYVEPDLTPVQIRQTAEAA